VISKSCAIALEWWLRKQGKFDGAKVATREIPEEYNPGQFRGTGVYEITRWEVPGVPQPTPEETNNIIDEYESAKPVAAALKETEKSVILSKLGITEIELKKVIE
jgi:hypothetical protein